jgi:hypothetical protein
MDEEELEKHALEASAGKRSAKFRCNLLHK